MPSNTATNLPSAQNLPVLKASPAVNNLPASQNMSTAKTIQVEHSLPTAKTAKASQNLTVAGSAQASQDVSSPMNLHAAKNPSTAKTGKSARNHPPTKNIQGSLNPPAAENTPAVKDPTAAPGDARQLNTAYGVFIGPLLRNRTADHLAMAVFKLLSVLGVSSNDICRISVNPGRGYTRVALHSKECEDYAVKALKEIPSLMNFFDLRELVESPKTLVVERVSGEDISPDQTSQGISEVESCDAKHLKEEMVVQEAALKHKPPKETTKWDHEHECTEKRAELSQKRSEPDVANFGNSITATINKPEANISYTLLKEDEESYSSSTEAPKTPRAAADNQEGDVVCSIRPVEQSCTLARFPSDQIIVAEQSLGLEKNATQSNKAEDSQGLSSRPRAEQSRKQQLQVSGNQNYGKTRPLAGPGKSKSTAEPAQMPIALRDAKTSTASIACPNFCSETVFFHLDQDLRDPSRYVECHSGTIFMQPKRFREMIGSSMCSLLNTGGGSIYVGVDRSVRVEGALLDHQMEDALGLDIDNMIKLIKPDVMTSAYRVNFVKVMGPDGKIVDDLKVLEVHVQPCSTPETPYTFKGVVYGQESPRTPKYRRDK